MSPLKFQIVKGQLLAPVGEDLTYYVERSEKRGGWEFILYEDHMVGPIPIFWSDPFPGPEEAMTGARDHHRLLMNAFREAASFIVGRALGVGSPPVVTVERRSVEIDPESDDVVIVAALAGQVAHRELTSAEPVWQLPRNRGRRTKVWHARATELVKEHWTTIRALVDALLDYRTIDAEEAALIVDASTDKHHIDKLHELQHARGRTKVFEPWRMEYA